MKIKFLSTLALAAVTFGMASCSSEEVAPMNGESTVTLSVTLPDGIQSRTFGDGKTANKLTVMVLDGNTPVAVLPGSTSVYNTDINLTKNIDLKLVNGKTYKVVCWAAAAEGSPYSFDTDNYTVTADYEGAVTSDEKLDAFFAAQDITVTGNTNETVKLYRPFAQLNIGTNDLADAKTAGFEASTVTVTVPTYKSLNLLTGEVEAGAPQSVTFGDGALPTTEAFPKDNYDYLSMNYIMMSTDKQLVDLEFTVKSTKGETRTLPLTAVPVQRNYRTNIFGSLLTNSVNVTIEIVPDFNEPDYERVATADMLAATLSAGNSATLDDNLELPTEMQVNIPADKDVVLNLNGKTISNRADIWNEDVTPSLVAMMNVSGGKLTINGNGKFDAKENDCYTFNVKDGAHLVIEDGTYYGNISVVQVQEGTCEIKGGTFHLKQVWNPNYMLNCIDAAYKAGNAKIVVTGGTFVGFNPADCASEGAHTDFVAPGYGAIKTTVDGQEAWEVVKTTEVTTGEELYSYDGKANMNLAVNSHITLKNTNFGLGASSSLFLNESGILDADVSGKPDITETLTVRGKITNIYGNGGKIVAPTGSGIDKNVQAIAVRNGRTINIYGNGTYEGGSGNAANQAINIVYGTANIYGGYFHTGLDKDGKSGQLIYLSSGFSSSWNANCNIYGGVFEMEGDPAYMINCYDNYRSKCTVKVYGGIFVGFNPADNDSDGEHTNYVAPGYKSVQITYNGKTAYQVVKE